MIDLLRDLCGIAEGDSAEAARAKLGDGIREAGNDLAWTTPFLRALLSLDLWISAIRPWRP